MLNVVKWNIHTHEKHVTISSGIKKKKNFFSIPLFYDIFTESIQMLRSISIYLIKTFEMRKKNILDAKRIWQN